MVAAFDRRSDRPADGQRKRAVRTTVGERDRRIVRRPVEDHRLLAGHPAHRLFVTSWDQAATYQVFNTYTMSPEHS